MLVEAKSHTHNLTHKPGGARQFCLTFANGMDRPCPCPWGLSRHKEHIAISQEDVVVIMTIGIDTGKDIRQGAIK